MDWLKSVWNGVWNWGVKWIKENPKRVKITIAAVILYGLISAGMTIPQIVFDIINSLLKPETPFESSTFTSGLAVFIGWAWAMIRFGTMTKTEKENLDKIPAIKKTTDANKKKIVEAEKDIEEIKE